MPLQSRTTLIPCLLCLILGAALLHGCGGNESATRPVKRPTIASLVPAATDLIIGMGAADHLVAISNYDVARPQTQGLPRVGDYQTLDWERIAAIRPDVMIVFMSPQRMPPGIRQRAEQLGIQLVNVRTERLEDILRTIGELASLTGEQTGGAMLKDKLAFELRQASEMALGRPPVSVLIARDKSLEGVVGRENFIDDVLALVGGQNVVQAAGWPSVDRELILSLKPQVIVQLLPEATPQVLAEARVALAGLESVPAVAEGRVHVLTEWWTQQPGSHVGELALRLAQILHREGR